MNKPYVKQFDSTGSCINDFGKALITEFPNRKARRAYLNQARLFGNGKNYHLTVTPLLKYKRVAQVEYDKEGTRKVIEHYLTK